MNLPPKTVDNISFSLMPLSWLMLDGIYAANDSVFLRKSWKSGVYIEKVESGLLFALLCVPLQYHNWNKLKKYFQRHIACLLEKNENPRSYAAICMIWCMYTVTFTFLVSLLYVPIKKFTYSILWAGKIYSLRKVETNPPKQDMITPEYG